MYVISSVDIIRNIVKEKGVAKLIINYKKRFEWVDLIDNYTFDNKVDWASLSKKQILKEDFIQEFKDKVNWLYICIYQSLSERFIEKHKSYILWRWISKYQKLSMGFIHKYREVLNWDLLCTYQKMSSKFIEEHRGYVNWLKIANHQYNLDPGFLARHNHDIMRDTNDMEYHEGIENIDFPDIN